jgi:hypothetical protein
MTKRDKSSPDPTCRASSREEGGQGFQVCHNHLPTS